MQRICALISIFCDHHRNSHSYFSYLRQPLHMAAANGHVHVLQALLAASADMEAQDSYALFCSLVFRFSFVA
jgi:ankyrin repeat protein